jgi:hypothetical protein
MPPRVKCKRIPVLQQIDNAEAHADPVWRDAAIAAVQKVAIRQDLFTAADIRQELDNEPVTTHDQRAVGAALLTARRLVLLCYKYGSSFAI